MSTWLLIFVLTTSSGGSAISEQFQSEDLCQIAAAKIKAWNYQKGYQKYECFHISEEVYR